eukprot:TRINITY_DN20325_c1_g1_i2.p2 TRINITY_DN20325_c1_g1~~TRINITY_DN20325_c1_g1_i2.p2  ORF type:complete len:211 (-),score=11.10 TRINITY_DN20325_c1_g1_i2:211-780(-)
MQTTATNFRQQFQRQRRLIIQFATVVDDVPQKLARHYSYVQKPASANLRYSAAIAEFAKESVLAYECGYSEQMLLKDLDIAFKNNEFESKFTRSVCIIWLTLMVMPKVVNRWSVDNSGPISDQTRQDLIGFVTLIVKGYYDRRMAWYPVDKLQTELSLNGISADLSQVSEWARMVYEILNTLAPQFPKA